MKRPTAISRLRHRILSIARKMPIETLYLFGSTARQDKGPLSDYDFAIHGHGNLSSEDRFALKLEVIGLLSQALKTDAIDVVMLEDAPPLLAHRILKEGVVLYCRNPLSRVRKEFELLTTYLD